jgi:hypothetical protein
MRFRKSIVIAAIAVSGLVGIGLYLYFSKTERTRTRVEQPIQLVKLIPPLEPPKPIGEKSDSKKREKTAGPRTVPAAPVIELTTEAPAPIRVGHRELSFNTGGEEGIGIRIGREGAPEFPWRTLVDRLNVVLHSNTCAHAARQDYRVDAQIDEEQKITLTRISSTGDQFTDECTDQELKAIARLTDTTSPIPYQPRVVSIEVSRYWCGKGVDSC